MLLLNHDSCLHAGKTEITWMMLDAGAETDVVNSVGRTAAQMAAFVGMDLELMTFDLQVDGTRAERFGKII